MDFVASETLVVVANNGDMSAARQRIGTEASKAEVRVNGVEENRRRFSTELTISVSGTPERIKAFRKAMGSRSLLGALVDSLTFWG
jgi:hypothetical protein